MENSGSTFRCGLIQVLEQYQVSLSLGSPFLLGGFSSHQAPLLWAQEPRTQPSSSVGPSPKFPFIPASFSRLCLNS